MGSQATQFSLADPKPDQTIGFFEKDLKVLAEDQFCHDQSDFETRKK